MNCTPGPDSHTATISTRQYFLPVGHLVSPDPEVPLPALWVAHEELVEQVVEVAQPAVPPQVVLGLAQERVLVPVGPDEGHLLQMDYRPDCLL